MFSCTVGNLIIFTIGTYLGTEALNQTIGTIFTFMSDTAELVIADNSRLDRETLDTYLFEVVAQDSNSARATSTVEITLTDINDNAPVITSPL